MPFLKINNNNIFYNINGNGFPIILLHDGFYNTTSWDSVRENLSKHYTVIDYDRFGYGQSDKYIEQLKGSIIKLYAEELASFVDALKLKEFHICGHCLGGAIALHYAFNHPEKINKIISESVGFFSDYKLLFKTDIIFRPFSQIDQKLKNDLIKMNGAEYAEIFWQFISTYKDDYIMHEDYNILSEIKNLSSPILLINGDRDFYFPVEHALCAYNKIRNSNLWIVPDTGHTPHIEKKDAFVEALLAFLK